MAKKAIDRLDKAVDRVGYWHGAYKLLSDNWHWLMSIGFSIASAVYALIYASFEYVQMIAKNVTWWVYPITILVILLSAIGLLSSIVLVKRFFQGKTALGADRSASKGIESSNYRELLIKIDSEYGKGILLRNSLDFRKYDINQKDFDDKNEQYKLWNRNILNLLSDKSIPVKEYSYFNNIDILNRTLLSGNPRTSYLLSIFNEKLKRLREIIDRLGS